MTRLHRPFNRGTPAWALLLVLAVLAKAVLPQGVMLSYDAQHGAQVTPCPGHASPRSLARSLPDPADSADARGTTSPPEPGHPQQGGHATCPFASAAAPVLPSSGAAAIVASRSSRQAPAFARLGWVRVASSSAPPQSRAPPPPALAT
jgi:hypothetical protein